MYPNGYEWIRTAGSTKSHYVQQQQLSKDIGVLINDGQQTRLPQLQKDVDS